MEHVQLSADLVSAQHTGNRANVRLGVTYANVGVLGSVCTSGHYCEVVLVTLVGHLRQHWCTSVLVFVLVATTATCEVVLVRLGVNHTESQSMAHLHYYSLVVALLIQ